MKLRNLGQEKKTFFKFRVRAVYTSTISMGFTTTHQGLLLFKRKTQLTHPKWLTFGWTGGSDQKLVLKLLVSGRQPLPSDTDQERVGAG